MVHSSIAVVSALLVTIVPYAMGSLDEIFAAFEGATATKTRPEVDRVVPFKNKGATVKTRFPDLDFSEKFRVVGGVDADPTLYPFFTFVQIDKTYSDGPGSELCAGSLIAPDIVTTAAHCFIEGTVDAITVRVNNTSVNETGYDYIRDVKSYERHPQFDEVTYNNDVGILVLSEAVTEVTPLALNGDAGVPAEGQDLELIGMGLLEENGTSPEFLQMTTIQSIPTLTCADLYSDTADGPIAIEASVQLCAAAPGKDACKGDSGAPLLLSTGSGFLMVGTVSFGIGCALPVSFFQLGRLIKSQRETIPR